MDYEFQFKKDYLRLYSDICIDLELTDHKNLQLQREIIYSGLVKIINLCKQKYPSMDMVIEINYNLPALDMDNTPSGLFQWATWFLRQVSNEEQLKSAITQLTYSYAKSIGKIKQR